MKHAYFYSKVLKKTAGEMDWYYSRVKESEGHLIWVGDKNNGTPYVRLDGKRVQVRRVVWESVNGKPMSDRRVAVACCEHALCVSPDCVKARTRSAILVGKKRTLPQKARMSEAARRLTDEQVRLARTLEGSSAQVAKQLGMGKTSVNRIRRNEQRADYSNPFTGLGAYAQRLR